jgi:hypothetical protein
METFTGLNARKDDRDFNLVKTFKPLLCIDFTVGKLYRSESKTFWVRVKPLAYKGFSNFTFNFFRA